jgi:hypothetical protein
MPLAQKGQRFGGRAKGVPNKKTIERAQMAERALTQVPGRKMAKEVLDEFMIVFAGMAAAYQPLPPGSQQTKPGADANLFEKWARLAVETAAKLAPYQSPTFRAIVVAPPPAEKDKDSEVKRFTLTVFEGGRRLPATMTEPQKAEG